MIPRGCLKYHMVSRIRQLILVWTNKKKSQPKHFCFPRPQAFGGPYLRAGFWKLLNDAGQFAGPVLLGQLISVVKAEGTPAWHGYAIAAAIFGGQWLGAVGENQYFNSVLATSIRVQGAVQTEIYHKSLRLSNQARNEQSVGRMINIISTDTEQLQKVCPVCGHSPRHSGGRKIGGCRQVRHHSSFPVGYFG